ncbi:hypothetical protein [Bacilliculturomica massiliensis]|uniref:hypothetical protein n=1 Tax=Bacilliculturomica massiliensis TaxID=1917867 RepID=UPI00102F451F|nr:hypothetical protein [Bacilliculturomica massiliensis]
MDQCRTAVRIGMPWDLFWHGPVYAFEMHLAVFNEKVKDRQMAQDIQAWNIGQYARQAMQSVFHLFNPFAAKARPPRYPEKPFIVQREEEEKIRAEDRIKRSYEALLKRFPKEKRGEGE